MIIQILILAVLLLPVPAIVGGLAVGLAGNGTSGSEKLFFRWVSGQIILWAGFQAFSVPLILARRDFQDVVILFSCYMAAAVLLAVAVGLRHKGKRFPGGLLRDAGREKDKAALFLWACVVALVLLQLVLACILAYEEGDDAFYVAISTITVDANTMYQKLPYTGGTTGMDIRHGLAPMPIWVAYLAQVSGMQAVTVAQIILPVVLIVMSYGIYFLLGRRLFPGGPRRTALFMLVLQFLVMFGGYSTYSAENFLLVRTAQGKSVLANIVIPFLLYLLLVILEKLQASEKTGILSWVMVALAMITGCLCSTQGTLLTCMLLGVVGLCILVCYRRWKLVLPLIGCGIVPAGMALLYFRLG